MTDTSTVHSLRMENERFREALLSIGANEPSLSHNNNLNDLIAVDAVRRARAALTETSHVD